MTDELTIYYFTIKTSLMTILYLFIQYWQFNIYIVLFTDIICYLYYIVLSTDSIDCSIYLLTTL